MNIFVLDESPVTSAQMQCDKHIVKMPLETAQMLCSVWHRYGVGWIIMIGYGNMVWSYVLNTPEGTTKYINANKLLWI